MIDFNDELLRRKIQLIGATVTQVSTRLDDDLHSTQYAAWTDRTGRARGSLLTVAEVGNNEASIVYGGTVPYMPFLDDRHNLIDKVGDKYENIVRDEILSVLRN